MASFKQTDLLRQGLPTKELKPQVLAGRFPLGHLISPWQSAPAGLRNSNCNWLVCAAGNPIVRLVACLIGRSSSGENARSTTG